MEKFANKADLCDIDAVWRHFFKNEKGEWQGFGLAHILDKHGKEFADIASELDDIVKNGVIIKESDDRYILKTDKHTLILGKRGDKKFTANILSSEFMEISPINRTQGGV